jgi:hypothetical protein
MVSEVFAGAPGLVDGVHNAEVMAAHGADVIVLNLSSVHGPQGCDFAIGAERITAMYRADRRETCPSPRYLSRTGSKLTFENAVGRVGLEPTT